MYRRVVPKLAIYLHNNIILELIIRRRFRITNDTPGRRVQYIFHIMYVNTITNELANRS